MGGWFILAVYTVVLHIGWWITGTPPRVDTQTDSYLSNALFDQLAGWQTADWLYHALGTLLLLTIALVLNNIHNRYKLSGYSNRITAAIFLLLSAAFPAFAYLSPTLISAFFLVWAMQRLMRLYNEEAPRVWQYDIGVLLGLATVFHPTSVWLIGWALLSMLLLRPPRLGDGIAMLLGVATPHYLLAAYLFWQDSLHLWWQMWQDISLAYSIEFAFNAWDYAKAGLILLLLIIFLVRNLSALFTYTIQVRKYIRVIIGLIPFVLITVASNRLIYLDHFVLLLVPLAIVFGFHFAAIIEKRWGVVVHALVFLLIILSQYLTFVA